MRFAVVLFALLAVVSSTFAALLARQSLPSCADACLVNASTGSCAATDDVCLCKNAAFINSTTTCITSSCSGNDVQNAEAFAEQLCLAVGVTLTPSSATATASASASATSTTSSSSGASVTTSISVFAGAVAALAIAAVL